MLRSEEHCGTQRAFGDDVPGEPHSRKKDTMEDLSKVPRVSGEYRVRQEGDHYILSFTSCSLSVKVNSSAMFLISLLEPCGYTVSEMIERFALAYGRAVEDVRSDVLGTLESLSTAGLIDYELPRYEPPSVCRFDPVSGAAPSLDNPVRTQSGDMWRTLGRTLGSRAR